MKERAIFYFYKDMKMSLSQVKSVLEDAKVEKEFKSISDKISKNQATNQERDIHKSISYLKWMESYIESYIEKQINAAKGGKPNTSN